MRVKTLSPSLLVQDRMAARAAWLVREGKLEPRDLRQMLPQYGSWILGPRIAVSRRSTVHKARHALFPWKAAVKLGEVDHEASLLRQWNHPRVIRLLDAGDGFLVMDLARRSLKDCGRIGERFARRIAADLSRALNVVHQAGWLHGDVKPGNILLEAGHRALLADFGAAGRIAEQGSAEVKGSWPYLAPECFHGERSVRSDLYSLGLTLHEALSGTVAVPAAGFRDARRMHHDLNLEPLHWTVPDVSRGLSNLIRRLTAKHPEDRPANAAEVHHELRTLGDAS